MDFAAHDSIDALVDRLTLDEQIALLAGADFWQTVPIERVGIPSLRVSDGPAGVRGTSFNGRRSLNVPCSTLLASTWNPSQVAAIGRLLGREARVKQAAVILAPTVNLHRTPIGGRNFECMSEDPYLTARTAVAYVTGVQDEGALCCIKHFVGNDTEFERNSIDAVIDERTLRELYLVPFEAAVTEADVGAVMTGYNRLNGTFCAESTDLIEGVLRGEWGFRGAVISDWYGLLSTVEGINAGVDLEMPGPTRYRGDALRAAVAAGDVTVETVRQRALSLLAFLERAGSFETGSPGPDDDSPGADADRELIRTTAAQGMVLLRNERAALPLAISGLRRIALIGPNADRGEFMGGGSAHVQPTHVRGVRDVLSERLAAHGIELVFAEGTNISKWLEPVPADQRGSVLSQFFATAEDADDLSAQPLLEQAEPSTNLMWVDNTSIDGTPAHGARVTFTFTPPESGEWTFAITSVADTRLFIDGQIVIDNSQQALGGSFFGLGKDETRGTVALTADTLYQVEARLDLKGRGNFAGLRIGARPPTSVDLAAEADAAAADCDLSIVVVGTNPDWESEGWDRDDISLPGSQDSLVSRVAARSKQTIVVVNAGSPVSMPWLDEVDAVLVVWFPGQEMADALADVLLGDAEPTGRLPVTFPRSLADTPAFEHHPGRNGQAHYLERRLVGYRWYDTVGKNPLFPFGFGLGYASIQVESAALAADGTVTVDLRNTSERDGVQVVQVYARDGESAPNGASDEPMQRLVGFARVEVPGGGTARAAIALDPNLRRTWDTDVHAWRLKTSAITLHIGSSSRDLPIEVEASAR